VRTGVNPCTQVLIPLYADKKRVPINACSGGTELNYTQTGVIWLTDQTSARRPPAAAVAT